MEGGFLPTVNVYAARDASGFVLFDSGHDSAGAWDVLLSELAAIGTSLAAIHTVVVTHGHLDHYGLADRIRAASGAEVWLHQQDQEYMQHRAVAPDVWSGWLQAYGVPPAIASRVSATNSATNETAAVAPPDRLLIGGETLRAGEYRFEVLWTPGHTPGHVCLLERAAALLVCGDHILPRVTPNVGLQPYLAENPLPAYLTALERTVALDLRSGLPGHGEPMTDLAGRASTLLEHQLNRQAEVLSLLSNVPQTPYDLAAQIWRDAKPTNWSSFTGWVQCNAVRTLAAHLELLVEHGLACRADEQVLGFSRAARS
jgi:glyoxylase-like metal-dependent hydrolase (beta-lactamase superfamily II)